MRLFKKNKKMKNIIHNAIITKKDLIYLKREILLNYINLLKLLNLKDFKKLINKENEDDIKELYTIALKQNPFFINIIIKLIPKDHVEFACLESVKSNGMVLKYILKYIKNLNENILLSAVKSEGYSLQFIKNKNYELCLEAVKQNPYAIKFVDKKFIDKNLILSALKNEPDLLDYISDFVENKNLIKQIKKEIKMKLK